MTEGFLLIDKPETWTSHDIVAYLRGVTGIKQIGHAGTLDPFATGLLILGIGNATKKLDAIHKFDKEYIGTIVFGATSDTDDCTGEILKMKDAKIFSEADLRNVLKTFEGETLQIPPMFAAKKVGGKKLYEIAREGKVIERAPAQIFIHEIELLETNLPRSGTIRVRCSTGTYIRALARDIGTALGTSAYLEYLRRTRIGPYKVENARGPKDFENTTWQKFLLSTDGV